jgi:hypothetical protein
MNILTNRNSDGADNTPAHAFPISRGLALVVLVALILLVALRHLFGSVHIEGGVR